MHDELTREDIRKMKEELLYRKRDLHQEIIKDLQEARAQGDLSENFEYYAARRANGRNNSRIRYLENMIKTARVIEDRSADDTVGINDRITGEFPEDGSKEVWRIVTTVRQNVLEGLIGLDSPAAKALMGHKAGDRVTIRVSDSFSYEVKIAGIEKNSDESGDRISSY